MPSPLHRFIDHFFTTLPVTEHVFSKILIHGRCCQVHHAAFRWFASRNELEPIFDRSPPYDAEAEIGVLGSIMLLPDVCDEIALRLKADDFHDDAHRKIFQHMLDKHDAGRKIDPTLLVDRLKSAGHYEAVGGAAYLGKILHSVANAAHAVYYAEIVREKATYRRLIEASTEILRDAYDESQEANLLHAKAESKVFSILEDRGGGKVVTVFRRAA